MAKTSVTSPFKAMEEEAYHAFREWPIFLLLRQKELEIHLAPPDPPQEPANTEMVSQHPESEVVKGVQ